MIENLEWMNEPVERLEKSNKFYRFICFLLRRKMTYKELYMLLSALNRKSMGDENAKIWAINHITRTYKYNQEYKKRENQ